MRNVSVVIPAYNSSKTIEQTLDGCINQIYDEGKIEVILVDDGSTDNTIEVLENYLFFSRQKLHSDITIKYIKQENQGPASARNTGWQNASYDVICFTDADGIPKRDWLSRLVNTLENLENNPSLSAPIGAVGGSYDIINKNSLLARCIHYEIIFRHSKLPKFVRMIGSFNMLARRSVMEAVEGFSADFRDASGEDNDLSYKILKTGYLLYFEKSAIIAHHHEENLWRYLKTQYKHGFWRMKLYQMHPELKTGDDYTNWKDIIEPSLALLISLLFPIQFFNNYVRISFGLFLFIYVFLQIFLPLKLFRKMRMPLVCFGLMFVTFLRGFARGWGMLKGYIRFKPKIKIKNA